MEGRIEDIAVRSFVPPAAPLPEARFEFVVAGAPSPLSVAEFTLTEALSATYEATIDLACSVPVFDAASLLGARAVLHIVRGPLDRRIGGIIRRVEDAGTIGEARRLRVRLVPRFWLLSQRVTHRIFQQMDTLTIVRAVLTDAGIASDRIAVETAREYPPREYCVQYGESDLAFVQRLLEEEGIAYFFRQGDLDEETIVLSDDSRPYGEVPTLDGLPVLVRGLATATAATESIRHATSHGELRPTGALLRDFDFTHPSAQLDVTCASPRRESGERVVYEYPARYNFHAYEGTAYGRHDGARAADARFAEARGPERTVSGAGNVTNMAPGRFVEIASAERDALDGRHLVVRVEHHGIAPEVLRDERSAETQDRYENHFELMPLGVPYRPARVTPVPVVRGVQTAMVVGPSAEEIHTDEHGRIKVQFHWDLEGVRDENSSAWIRVAQSWGGAGWGFTFTPRVGMEVVVAFLEGNPDRPLVVGCVYNGESPTPYALPASKTRSTIRTRSTPGGEGFNEIRFEDAAGSEEVFVHAQKDMNERVGNDHTMHVGSDQSNVVGSNQTQSIGANQTESVGANQSMHVGGSRSASVGGGESLSVGGAQSETVGASRTQSIGASDTLTVAAHQSVTVGASANLDVTGTYDVSATARHALSVGATTITADTSSIESNASDHITLTVGGASIRIEPSKITVSVPGSTFVLDGATIAATCATLSAHASGSATVAGDSSATLQGSAATVKGSNIVVHGDQVEVSGSTTSVKGSGAHVKLTGDAEIEGGTVNINA